MRKEKRKQNAPPITLVERSVPSTRCKINGTIYKAGP